MRASAFTLEVRAVMDEFSDILFVRNICARTACFATDNLHVRHWKRDFVVDRRSYYLTNIAPILAYVRTKAPIFRVVFPTRSRAHWCAKRSVLWNRYVWYVCVYMYRESTWKRKVARYRRDCENCFDGPLSCIIPRGLVATPLKRRRRHVLRHAVAYFWAINTVARDTWREHTHTHRNSRIRCGPECLQ